MLQSLTNLSHADFMKNTYLRYRSWPVVYDYIRSEECEFPQHVRQMLIDWDTSGWGYLGEDLASLIADESDIDHMVEYYQRCIPAYYKAFSEYADVSPAIIASTR